MKGRLCDGLMTIPTQEGSGIAAAVARGGDRAGRGQPATEGMIAYCQLPIAHWNKGGCCGASFKWAIGNRQSGNLSPPVGKRPTIG